VSELGLKTIRIQFEKFKPENNTYFNEA